MLKFAAQALTALSLAWLSVHLFLLQGGYREEIFDEFLRSREFDQAMGAAFVFLQTFLIPLLAVAVSCLHSQKEKSKAALTLLLTAGLATMLGLILYFVLP